MRSRWARVARGTLIALFAVFVAVFSHVAAGGAAPGGVGLVLAVTFGILASIAVAGKRLTLPRLGIAVALSQMFLHVLFTVGAESPPQFHQASHHGAIHVTATPMSDGMSMGFDDGAMWIAHALAAVVTILFLWRGERAVWAVLTAAAGRLVAVLIGAIRFEPIRSHGVAVSVVAAALRTIRDDLGVVVSAFRHRGPPVLN